MKPPPLPLHYSPAPPHHRHARPPPLPDTWYQLSCLTTSMVNHHDHKSWLVIMIVLLTTFCPSILTAFPYHDCYHLSSRYVMCEQLKCRQVRASGRDEAFVTREQGGIFTIFTIFTICTNLLQRVLAIHPTPGSTYQLL